jgi:UDP-3-O-[3-hydroxymyristoyl] glucosamine N-acyltransferase
LDRLASLQGSKPTEIAFFFSRAFEQELPLAQPGVLVTGDAFVAPLEAAHLPLWKKTVVISCADPYLAMAILSEKFASLSPGSHLPRRDLRQSTIHESAQVHETAELAKNVQIGAFCVIGAHTQVGQGAVIEPGCVIGNGCVIGEDTVLFPRVVLYDGVQLGARVRVHSGAVLGGDGFGYAPVVQDKKVVGHRKIYHTGRVVIGDDVEIGANSAVDRATLGETRIDRNAKIDNLVQVGHNVKVGEGAIVCGGCCLAGNSSLGKYTYVLGMSGVINHIHVGDGARVAAHTCVSKDVEPGATVAGNPQRSYSMHFRVHAMLNKLVGQRRKK